MNRKVVRRALENALRYLRPIEGYYDIIRPKERTALTRALEDAIREVMK